MSADPTTRKGRVFAAGLSGDAGEGEFFFDEFLAGLGELGLGFDAEAGGVVEEFVDAFIGDFSAEEFADAGLGFAEDDLQLLAGIVAGVFEDGLIELGLEFEGGGLPGRKAEVFEHVSAGEVGGPISGLFHVFSPRPNGRLFGPRPCGMPARTFAPLRGAFANLPGTNPRHGEYS